MKNRIIFASFVLVGGLLVFWLSANLRNDNANKSIDYYLATASDFSMSEPHWSYEETYNIVHYEAINNGQKQNASRSLVGYYGRADMKLFITTQVDQYSLPVNSDMLSKIDYGFVPDDEFVPHVSALAGVQNLTCGRNFDKNNSNGYVVCIAQIIFEENYIYSITAHGDGRINDDEWGEIVNELLTDANNKFDKN